MTSALKTLALAFTNCGVLTFYAKRTLSSSFVRSSARRERRQADLGTALAQRVKMSDHCQLLQQLLHSTFSQSNSTRGSPVTPRHSTTAPKDEINDQFEVKSKERRRPRVQIEAQHRYPTSGSLLQCIRTYKASTSTVRERSYVVNLKVSRIVPAQRGSCLQFFSRLDAVRCAERAGHGVFAVAANICGGQASRAV